MLLSLLPPSLLGGDPSLLRALGDPALRECTSSAPSADATLGRALERSLERSLERRGATVFTNHVVTYRRAEASISRWHVPKAGFSPIGTNSAPATAP